MTLPRDSLIFYAMLGVLGLTVVGLVGLIVYQLRQPPPPCEPYVASPGAPCSAPRRLDTAPDTAVCACPVDGGVE